MCHIHWGSQLEVPICQINIGLASALIMCPPAMQADRVRSPVETCLSRDALLVDSGPVPPWCPPATQRKKRWSEKWREKACGANSNVSKQNCGFLDCSCSVWMPKAAIDWLVDLPIFADRLINKFTSIIKHTKKTKQSDLLIFSNYGIGHGKFSTRPTFTSLVAARDYHFLLSYV